jgi:putative MATE family efflux protein
LKNLTEGKPGTQILHFAWPMLAGNIFQQLYNVVDSIVIGQYIGKEALAAVGASFPFIFALVSFIIGIAIGSTVIIAQYFGAKEVDKVKQAIETLYIFMFFASITLTTLGIYFSNGIFGLISLPADVLPLAVKYFKIYALGFIFFFGYQGTGAILRGLGDSRTPFYFLAGSTILNIIFDILFVAEFHWGIEGVAGATVLSQAIAFFSIVIYVNKYHSVVSFSPLKMRFSTQMFKKALKIGFPAGIQQTIVAVGFMALYRIVNMFGTSTIAAYSIAMRIDSFAVMPAMNFSAALSTFTGQNIGAGKMLRVSEGLRATLKMTITTSIFISTLAIIFADPLMHAFTNDTEVIMLGKQYLYIVSPFYILFSVMFAFSGVLRGAGDTLMPMFFTILSLWVIRIPVSYFLSTEIGTKGIWWGIPIAWTVGVSMSWLYFKTGKWKNKAVVKRKIPEDKPGEQESV